MIDVLCAVTPVLYGRLRIMDFVDMMEETLRPSARDIYVKTKKKVIDSAALYRAFATDISLFM